MSTDLAGLPEGILVSDWDGDRSYVHGVTRGEARALACEGSSIGFLDAHVRRAWIAPWQPDYDGDRCPECSCNDPAECSSFMVVPKGTPGAIAAWEVS